MLFVNAVESLYICLEMIQFEKITYLNLLWLLIPLVLLFALYISWRSKALQQFATKHLLARLAPKTSTTKHYTKFILLLVAFALLGVGLSNPQIGTKLETVKREGVDVMIAIDVSKSMQAKDIQPSRMQKARQLVSNLIDKMANDRIGLIVFAGNAYLQMPLTIDYSASKMYLKQINTDLVPNQGTAIGDAIDIAIRSYPKESNHQKVLLLITDGENHEGNADDAIKMAKENNIKVISIGVGTSKGAPIPTGRKGEFKKDIEGNIVQTKLNEAMLKKMAQQANGAYYNIADKNIEKAIVNQLGSLDGKVFEEKVITDYKDYFQLFLLFAFLLLLVEWFIHYKKSKINQKLFQQ